MIREILFEDESKRKLAQGIGMLCEVLQLEGRILLNGHFSYSALEVSKQIEGRDLWTNQGIRLAAAAIAEINARTGCGSGVAAEMILKMLKAEQRLVAASDNAVQLAKELTLAAEEVTERIQNLSFQTKKPMLELLSDVVQDRELAEMIASAMETGEVSVKESLGMDTKLEIMKGIEVDGTILCGPKGTWEDVRVLATDAVITSFQTILPILEAMEGRSLLIVAEDITGEALTLLTRNVKEGRIKVWAVKASGIGRRKVDMYGDMVAFTKTQLFHSFDLEDSKITIDDLGWSKQIEMRNQSVVISGDYQSERIQKRLQNIQERLQAPDTNYYDQQILRARMAALVGDRPVIYAGGATLVQAKEEKLRIEYALAYAQTVQKYGVVSLSKLLAYTSENKTVRNLIKAIQESFSEDEQSAWLLMFTITKVTGMLRMWMTTGAMMVSTNYDREDIELMKSGVDINGIRGCV